MSTKSASATAEHRQAVAIEMKPVMNGSKISKYAMSSVIMLSNNWNSVLVPDTSENVFLPIVGIKDGENIKRTVVYISGASGSGKTVLTSNLAYSFRERFPKANIFLISRIAEDEAYDKIRNLVRVDPATIIDANDWLQGPDCKNSLIILDDADVFDDENLAKVQKINQLGLEIGRHNNISMIKCSHLTNKAHDTRLQMLETHWICLFPATTLRHSVDYFCKTYVGMKKNDIDDLYKDVSCRWVALSCRAPFVKITRQKISPLISKQPEEPIIQKPEIKNDTYLF